MRHWIARAGGVALALVLAGAQAPQAAETQLSIRITPGAAALIAALRQGMSPTAALAAVPEAGSTRAFTRSCMAEGGNPSTRRDAGTAERICL